MYSHGLVVSLAFLMFDLFTYIPVPNNFNPLPFCVIFLIINFYDLKKDMTNNCCLLHFR